MTAVGAFSAAGSILVVALMIAPPASAYLLVDNFKPMLLLSAALGALGAVVIVPMLGCIAVPALWQIRNSRSGSGGWLLVGELSGLSAMLAHSLVDFNLRIPANALLFVVILALTHNTARGLRLAQHYADTRAAAKV